MGEYDEIEIPPVKPYVIRHRRFRLPMRALRGRGESAGSAVATTTRLEPRIHALAIYLKGFQALSYERVRGLFGDALAERERGGADEHVHPLASPGSRSRPKGEGHCSRRQGRRQRRDRRSDRGDRLGITGFSTARKRSCISRLFPRRRVVDDDGRAYAGSRISDRFRRSKSMASGIKPVWRTGPRHRFRVSSTAADDLPFRFKLWLGKAFDLARTIADFAASTLARKKRDLEKQLETLLAAPTGCDLARELQAKIGRARDQLLTFCDYPGEVDVTQQHLGAQTPPCVIQRKVTNGYRASGRQKPKPMCEQQSTPHGSTAPTHST